MNDITNDTNENGLLDGRLRMRQPAKGYRSAIDPVLLAAAVDVKPGARVADLGAGVGTVGLCLAARVADITVEGLEILAALVDLAWENARLNGMEDCVHVTEGDVLHPPEPFRPDSFDVVTVNPPYVPPERGRPSEDPIRATANVEGTARLGDWVRAARRLLRRGGVLALVHRADRLEAVLAELGAGFGDVRIFPLWPKTGRPASRVIVRATKESRAPMTLLPGLVLHGEDGGFTPEAERILRHVGALDLSAGT